MNGREKSHYHSSREADEQRSQARGLRETRHGGGTLRTLNREGASRGLDRVRKAARDKKKEKFTALLHLITVDSPEDRASSRTCIRGFTGESVSGASRARGSMFPSPSGSIR